MSTPPPTVPRFVPTLTEVVPHQSAIAVSSPTHNPAPAVAPAHVEAAAGIGITEWVEGQIVQRVLQRVDMVLADRLSEAVAAVVQEQTRSLLPRLGEEIADVVQTTVAEALAHELSVRGRDGRSR